MKAADRESGELVIGRMRTAVLRKAGPIAVFLRGFGHGLRRLSGREVPLTDEEAVTRDALQAEFDDLEAEYAEAQEVPEEIDQRLGEIETALEALEDRPVVYEPDDIARAGAFVSIDALGCQTLVSTTGATPLPFATDTQIFEVRSGALTVAA